MAEQLGSFLKKLHSFSTKQFKLVPYDEFDRLHIDKRKSRLIDSIKQLRMHEDIPLFHLAEDYAKKLTHIEVPTVHVLTHGDLHIRNMLINEKRN